MPTRIRTFTDRAGNEVSVLVDESNQPLFWPNVFAVQEYRHSSPKTLSAVLRALGMFEVWASHNGYDGSKQLARGEFIELHEAESLAGFLRLTKQAQDQEVLVTEAVSLKKITRIESVRKSQNRSSTTRFADRIQAANRIRWVIKFLEYLRDRGLSTCITTQQRKSLENIAGISINRLKRLVPRGGSYTLNEDLVGIDENEIQKIGKELNSTSSLSTNPFKTPFLKSRNYLIWALLVETGIRRNELISIKVDDIDYSTRRVQIRESKTLPRTLPISEKAAETFHHFVMEYWSKLPAKSTKHGKLFISENGAPLKTGSINAIFRRILETIPDLPQHLTPHTLRRAWNERFSAKIDSLPPDKRPSPSQESEIRNRLMGWRDGSQMSARYAKRHIRKKADSIAEELANSITDPEGTPYA